MQVKQQNEGYYTGMYLHNKSIFQQISKNFIDKIQNIKITEYSSCLLYTSDAADEHRDV